MQLSVKGKQLDVGEALRTHIEGSLDRVLSKYFGNVIEAQVTLSRNAHLFHAVLSAHVGRNIHLSAQDEAEEPYRAFDGALDRLSKRLRRHKRRLRDHHKEQQEAESLSAQQYVLAAEEDLDDEVGDETASGSQPTVVAEMVTEIPSLTVSQAVMRMDLAELSAMMFRNSAHGGLNMVYRRPDGNIGWIDPQGNQSS